MRDKFAPFIDFTAPRLIRIPGQSLRRAAGQRTWCHGFCTRDNFIMTRDFTAVYWTLQKPRHRDADAN
jgi:hypothetical protein